jgi:diketogulonate reductase-like aldo/keto reductase
MILEETYTLSNGVEIPRLGLGTWLISNADVVQAVKDAPAIGYRHIDTAHAYGNEDGVGDAIRTSGVNRDEIFLTTKLAAEVKSYEQAVKAIDGSLETMGFDHGWADAYPPHTSGS